MVSPSFVIAIAGGTGAGKTTVSRFGTRNVDDAVTRIPIDDYYEDRSHLDFAERKTIDYDHPPTFERGLLRDPLGALLEGKVRAEVDGDAGRSWDRGDPEREPGGALPEARRVSGHRVWEGLERTRRQSLRWMRRKPNPRRVRGASVSTLSSKGFDR